MASTRSSSARRARPASAANARRPGSCHGRDSAAPATRNAPMRPWLSSATNAACGRSRNAGSHTARRTANGSPYRVAARATAALSRSTATAPVRDHRTCFACAVATTVPSPNSAPSVGPPNAADRAASVAQRVSVASTQLGTTNVPGVRPGSRPPAKPKLTSPPTPRATSLAVATSAPAGPPPPTSTGRPRRRAMRASASRPVTTP